MCSIQTHQVIHDLCHDNSPTLSGLVILDKGTRVTLAASGGTKQQQQQQHHQQCCSPPAQRLRCYL